GQERASAAASANPIGSKYGAAARRAAAARLARDRRGLALLLAPGLSGGASAAPPRPPSVLGLRRARAHGRARRQRLGGDRRGDGLHAPLPRAVPDPEDAAD